MRIVLPAAWAMGVGCRLQSSVRKTAKLYGAFSVSMRLIDEGQIMNDVPSGIAFLLLNSDCALQVELHLLYKLKTFSDGQLSVQINKPSTAPGYDSTWYNSLQPPTSILHKKRKTRLFHIATDS